jgi:tryptophanyl-tRNA synthetase
MMERHPPQTPARVVSGIQPTGELHIGNYFGAIANWVALQAQYECIYGVVDLHAMTMPYVPAHLRANTERMVIDLLACGLDPDRSILFIQSLVPEHTELGWVLSCLASYEELSHLTQFREKAGQLADHSSGHFVSAGLFTYPVLQAADILIYRAQYVPIGTDQEQHLQRSALLARRFNTQFGTNLFPEPRPLFSDSPAIRSLLDPARKMSKSLGPRHYIGLFEEPESIRRKVQAAVTDPGILPPGVAMSPGVANLLAILRACGQQETATSLQAGVEGGQPRYGELKAAVAEALVALTGTLRARRAAILEERDRVQEQVQTMSERARRIAGETMREVRALVGLPEQRS